MYLGGHNKNHSEDRENGTREQQNIEVAMMISQNISIPTLEGLGQNPNQKENYTSHGIKMKLIAETRDTEWCRQSIRVKYVSL